MVTNRFVAKRVEPAGRDIRLQLSVPAILIALGDPVGEFAKVLSRQLEDFVFELFEGHVRSFYSRGG